MVQTVAEKIISAHAGERVRAGDWVVVRGDGVMATDATDGFALKAFEEMGSIAPRDPSRVAFVLDHAAPAPNERTVNIHKGLREFANQHGCHLYAVGAGICHQLIVEYRHVRPDELSLGADSHTLHCGALNVFAVWVGSTDLAATVIARSFARIFYRNAIHIGLLLLGTPNHMIEDGNLICFDIESGWVWDKSRGQEWVIRPLPPLLRAILDAGGLAAYLKAYGDFQLKIG